MKLLIAGSRGITDFDISQCVPKDVDLIISGGARGIDTLAEEYADSKRISKLILRPRYEIYGRCAPLKRDEKMVDLCDEIIVIWDGKSNGSKHVIDCARKSGKPAKIIFPDL